MSLNQGDIYNEPGAVVSDNVDIGLDPVITGSVNTNVIGTYTLRYNAIDNAGNKAVEKTRTVTILPSNADTTKPVIRLNGDSTITLEVKSAFNDPLATVSDNKDINVNLITSGVVNTGVVGTYTLRYNAIDNAGNRAEEVVRTVRVVDTTRPVVTLNGSSTIRVKVGDTYTEPGMNVSDNYDSANQIQQTISGSVNISAVGTYTLTYSARDSSGNTSTPVQRQVIVEEQVKDTANKELNEEFSGSFEKMFPIQKKGLSSIYFSKENYNPGEKITIKLEVVDQNINQVSLHFVNSEDGAMFSVSINPFHNNSENYIVAPRFSEERILYLDYITIFYNDGNYTQNFDSDLREIKVFLKEDSVKDNKVPILNSLVYFTNDKSGFNLLFSDYESGINNVFIQYKNSEDNNDTINWRYNPNIGENNNEFRISIFKSQLTQIYKDRIGKTYFLDNIKVIDNSGNINFYTNDQEEWDVSFKIP
jgi:hypothetical protein